MYSDQHNLMDLLCQLPIQLQGLLLFERCGSHSQTPSFLRCVFWIAKLHYVLWDSKAY
ncbi:uncharacterized protein DS421_14g455090 [Arachis hypogaea]|nr:uncharacterized protein DS421_14g455090 [Arachis hypogaea]